MIIRGKMLVSTTPYTDGDDCDVTMSPDAARCAEIAALEREIGRAVIAEDMAIDAAARVGGKAGDMLVDASNAAGERLTRLITRWRELHAAGEASARELADAKAETVDARKRYRAAREQMDALHALCERQADILSRVAVALRGPEPPQTRWSHADLPERAAAVVRERDDLRARFTAAIDELRGMSDVMKRHQMLPNTSAAIDERITELTGSSFQPDDLRERLAILAAKWEEERKEWEKHGHLTYSVALERASREIRALLTEEEAK